MPKQPSMLTRQVIVDGLLYLLKGGFWIKHGHLPVTDHPVPDDFIGICVATNADPATDDYVLDQLAVLGLNRVRLDVANDDMYVHQCRFLQRLLDANFLVDVHLVQPFVAAKSMLHPDTQHAWQVFVEQFLAQFATRIHSLEIGNTINRKRWAGYHWPGFIHTWEIAYRAAQAYQVKIAGPNIQDFEPLYNISALKRLRALRSLPTLHSNNLFVERVIEPEQPDHRIFKHRWTRCLRFNLIKKARILQKIGQDFGVPQLISPVAFWAIYRIQRILPDGPQKQADYLTRYFTLLAASGAVQQANWGAMICQREGVINDGLLDQNYPGLERVAYYRSADGSCEQYSANPSFLALKTIAYWLNGAHYQSALATGEGLEVHCLRQRETQIHIIWTLNGRCQLLSALYSPEMLQAAKVYNRDGEPIRMPGLVCETPIYLMWPLQMNLDWNLKCGLSPVRIHAHIANQYYFPVNDGHWQGMLLASSAEEAAALWQALHPESLQAPDRSNALRHARNVIWSIPDPRQAQACITVKKPVHMHIHKQYLDRWKPSKALRSWNGAMELMRRGINTAKPIAYFERIGDHTLKQNFFLCEYVPHDFTLALPWQSFNQGAASYAGLSQAKIYQAFAQFCHRMHTSGIYFRDFSAGNILARVHDGEISFSLIDTARLRTFPLSTPMRLRLADLTRALNKLDWAGRRLFLQNYLAMSGIQLHSKHNLPFYLYDCKVALKRTLGRKGIRKALRWIKSKLA